MAVRAPAGPLLELIERTLELYDVRWQLSPPRPVEVEVEVVARAADAPAEGRYLECAQMLVDPLPDGLRATTLGGSVGVARFGADGERWHLNVPRTVVRTGRWVEVEDLLSLIVTTGWRRAGWVPLHAGGLVKDRRGVLVCATSGGGKTTFTIGLVRRGWRTLGDDKLLLGRLPGEPGGRQIVGGLLHVLNLDPAAAAWFPEVRNVAATQPYSTWSPKRRVPLASIWPDAAAYAMRATDLVIVERRPGRGSIALAPLSRSEVLGALLRQTVIPTDRAVARSITAAIAELAAGINGHRATIHDDAYADPLALDGVEAALA